MRFLEKFFLFIFTLCLAALGVGGIWACYDANLLHYVNWAATLMTQNRWLTLIGSACLLLFAILLLFGVVFSSSGRRKESPAQNVIMVGEAADNVQISTVAVDCIIQQLKNNFPAVQDLETRISQASDGVQVMLKVVAVAEANIPQLARLRLWCLMWCQLHRLNRLPQISTWMKTRTRQFEPCSEAK